MNIDDAKKRIDSLALEATADEDGILAVYFSRESDRFYGQNVGIDSADAMLVIRQLVKTFSLDPEFITHLLELRGGSN